MVFSVATSPTIFAVLTVVFFAELARFFELAAEAFELLHELLVEDQLPNAEQGCQHDENDRFPERAAHEPPTIVSLLAGGFEANDCGDRDEEPHQEAYEGGASHQLAQTALLEDFLVDLVLTTFATVAEMSITTLLTLLLESVRAVVKLGTPLNGKELLVKLTVLPLAVSVQMTASVASLTARMIFLHVFPKSVAVLGEFGLGVALVGASAAMLHHFVEAGREKQVEARAGHEEAGENEQGQ